MKKLVQISHKINVFVSISFVVKNNQYYKGGVR